MTTTPGMMTTTTPTFFIYDDPHITLASRFKKCRGKACAPECSLTEDEQLLELLWRHPARTRAPEAAQLFVIPTPILRVWACHGGSAMGVVNSALRTVIAGEWFARSGGHDHLLPAHSWRFTVWANKKRGSGVGLPAETWALLENVTQTRNEYYAMSRWRNSWEDRDGFEAVRQTAPLLYADEHELTMRSVVMPKAIPPELPVVAPSPAEWAARPLLLYYHTRDTRFAHHATWLRQLPVRMATPGGAWAAACRSATDGDGGGGGSSRCDVGFATNQSAWVRGWSSSRFCLVLRGDTPTSHAFYHAVASGCVPVVISDGFERFGLPFAREHYAAGRLKLDEIAVIVDEATFLKRPEELPSRLLALPHALVAAKLAAMSAAQPWLVMTHPQAVEGCATQALVQTWRQLQAPAPTPYVRSLACAAINETRSMSRPKDLPCLHNVTFGCQRGGRGQGDELMLWRSPACPVRTFQCGERLVTAEECAGPPRKAPKDRAGNLWCRCTHTGSHT